MKKLFSTAVLLMGLLASNQASAIPVVDAGNIAQSTISAIQDTLTAASAMATEVKTSMMQAWDKSAWTQQLKGAWEQLQTMKNQLDELKGMRDDFMNTLSGSRGLGDLITESDSEGVSNVSYNYTPLLPDAYTPKFTCSADNTNCTDGVGGYKGKASGSDSVAMRKALKVSNGGLGGLLLPVNVRQLSNEAAEENAQKTAVIQAMAQEAYAQATNRIQKIKDLQDKINGVTQSVNTKTEVKTAGLDTWTIETPAMGGSRKATKQDGNSRTAEWSVEAEKVAISGGPAKATSTSSVATTNQNDLKYIADLQARIQIEQALLINDQNKIASLAILQQSQRDAYEQRKHEIAAYAVSGGGDSSFENRLTGVLVTAGVTAAQGAAFASVKNSYKTY